MSVNLSRPRLRSAVSASDVRRPVQPGFQDQQPQRRGDEDRASPHALDLDHYIPAQLTYLANKVSASASALYRPRFGIGIADWRVMAMLAAEPWITAGRVVEATGMDKGAVSRCLRDLTRAGLVEVRADARHGRRQLAALTLKGLALHDQIVGLAVERERQLLRGFSEEERKLLLGFLMRMRAQVPSMSGSGEAEAK